MSFFKKLGAEAASAGWDSAFVSLASGFAGRRRDGMSAGLPLETCRAIHGGGFVTGIQFHPSAPGVLPILPNDRLENL